MGRNRKRKSKEEQTAQIPRKVAKKQETLDLWSKFESVKASFRGQSIEPHVWMMFARLFYYLTLESIKGMAAGVKNVWDRFRQYTGVSKSTLSKLIESVESTGDVPVEHERRQKQRPKLDALDCHQLSQLRRWVLDNTNEGTVINVADMCKRVKEFYDIDLSDTTMRRILNVKLGLSYVRIRSKGTMLESDRILDLVDSYLQQIKELDALPEAERPLAIYTDESFVHVNYAVNKMWAHVQDEDRVFGSPKGKGRRIVIIHFGCQEGWIPEGKKVWACSVRQTESTEDYHRNVDGRIWLSIFEEVCRALQARGKHAVFFMDNARYHKLDGDDEVRREIFDGRCLSKTTVPQLKAYCDRFKIPYGEKEYRPELLKKVALHYKGPGWQSVQMAQRYGHRIIFTPPYWPQFQPIETAWAIVKGYVARHRKAGEYTVDKTLELLEAGFNEVTPEVWQKLVLKTKNFEEMWRDQLKERKRSDGTWNPANYVDPDNGIDFYDFDSESTESDSEDHDSDEDDIFDLSPCEK